MKNVILAVMAFILLSTTALASEAHGGSHKHHVALFVGTTMMSVDEEGQTVMHTYPTIGLDYIYNTGLLNNKLGIGLLGEVIIEDEHSAYIVGVPISFNITKSFKAFIAPALEFKEIPVVTPKDPLAGETEMHSEFLFRVGVAYDFHISKISVSPTVAVDFVDGHQAYVMGIAFGYGF